MTASASISLLTLTPPPTPGFKASEEAKEKIKDAGPRPHPLLRAVSELTAARESALQARRDEAEAYVRSLRTQLRGSWNEAYERAKASHRSAVREGRSEKRVRLLQEWYRNLRNAPKPLWAQSRQELLSELCSVTDEDRRTQGYLRRGGETEAQWLARRRAIHERVDEIRYILFEHQRDDKLVYVEGFPVNLHMTIPRLPSLRKPRATGAGKCLQCRAKRLPCSHDAVARNVDAAGNGECRRCHRAGEKCLVKVRREDEDVPWNYVYANKARAKDDGQRAADELYALIKSLWAVRSKEGRIMPLEAWHVNDRPENRTDPEFKPLSWKQVLKGCPTKWRFMPGGERQLIASQEPGETPDA